MKKMGMKAEMMSGMRSKKKSQPLGPADVLLYISWRHERSRTALARHEKDPDAKKSGIYTSIRKGGQATIRCVSDVRRRWTETLRLKQHGMGQSSRPSQSWCPRVEERGELHVERLRPLPPMHLLIPMLGSGNIKDLPCVEGT